MPDALALVPSEVRQPPTIPFAWDYDESVAEVRQLVYKWKNITVEIADELYIAREKLSTGGRSRNGDKSWSQYCGEIGVDRSTAHRWLDRIFGESVANATLSDTSPLPEGVFDVILADPPWQYDNQIESWGPTSLHYPSMSIEEICALAPLPCADNAALFLWVTNPFVEAAFDVLRVWGFEYKTNIVWVKRNLTRPGSGFYVRGRHELLFLCTNGAMVPEQAGREPIGSVLEADVQEHSRKPDAVYELIESIYPEGKYLELFARRNRPGWTTWGNDSALSVAEPAYSGERVNA